MSRLKNTADWGGVLLQHLNQLWVHLTGEAAAAPDDQSVDDDKQGQTIKPYLPVFVFCSLQLPGMSLNQQPCGALQYLSSKLSSAAMFHLRLPL